MGKRKKLTDSEKSNLLLQNAGVCCVCKARGVGINFHHINHDPSNNDASNIAVLCVEDHDVHHRPQAYRKSKHTDLGMDKIRAYKEEWEAFVADAKTDHPQSIAVINAYGTVDKIHSVRLIGNVSDLDFLWNVCHADAFFRRGNGEGGIRWYSCRFFAPTVKVIGL